MRNIILTEYKYYISQNFAISALNRIRCMKFNFRIFIFFLCAKERKRSKGFWKIAFFFFPSFLLVIIFLKFWITIGFHLHAFNKKNSNSCEISHFPVSKQAVNIQFLLDVLRKYDLLQGKVLGKKKWYIYVSISCRLLEVLHPTSIQFREWRHVCEIR